MAIQLASAAGARAIAVVSDEAKAAYARKLGAVEVINRSEFSCWGRPPAMDRPEEYAAYLDRVKEFGRAVRQAAGRGAEIDLVFEHPGRDTFAVSCFLVRRGGMVVFCAATSGFELTFDARYVWMRQKRIQGSHFANLKQAAEANRLVMAGRVDPCLSEVFPWSELPSGSFQDAQEISTCRATWRFSSSLLAPVRGLERSERQFKPETVLLTSEVASQESERPLIDALRRSLRAHRRSR